MASDNAKWEVHDTLNCAFKNPRQTPTFKVWANWNITTNKMQWPGPGCSKLTMLLVNVSLKFQTLILQINQYFLLRKCEKLLHCKSFSHFFDKNFSVFGYKALKHLTGWPLNELVKLTTLWTTGPRCLYSRPSRKTHQPTYQAVCWESLSFLSIRIQKKNYGNYTDNIPNDLYSCSE